jgi:hypothetical protein
VREIIFHSQERVETAHAEEEANIRPKNARRATVKIKNDFIEKIKI